MNKLVFQTAPQVELGTNTFVNCPIILQFDDTPLIEIVRLEQAGFSTQIPIYHQDGTYLAKVVGSQIHRTDSGKKAGLEMQHLDKITVCKLDNEILFEIRRQGAAALKTVAELYTPKGYFVKFSDESPSLINSEGGALQIGGVTMIGNVFSGCRIGVLIKSDGSVSMGCS